MLGYSVFAYEGIGLSIFLISVLPVQEICADKKKYPKIVLYTLITMFCLFNIFGLFSLFVYGDKLTSAIIFDDITSAKNFIDVVRLFYCLQIYITFPLTILPSY